MSVTRIQNYIGGQFCDPQSGQWIDNFEPATGQIYSQVANSNRADVDDAVLAAQAAQTAWGRTSPDDRAAAMFRLADAIDARAEELTACESRDNGKPEWLAAQVDIPRSAKNLRHFAASVVGYSSQAHPGPDTINYTLRSPVGVVGVISPWNLPLYLFTWKIAPALATGNCVIGKPSEVTPMTAFLLAEICDQADFPRGVLNIVHGQGAQTGNAMLEHPKIKAISFTGGTTTGRHVAATVAPQFKKLSLELGGKNPNIIFADCDYEKMLDTTVRSSFSNQGQICLCGSRIYIEESLYERFKHDFVGRAKRLTVGDPQCSDSQLGAIVSKPHFEKILECIERARAEGGTVLCGGAAEKLDGRCEHGWFVQPTVIEGLDNQCQTNQQEIFGPVVSIQPFRDEAHALELANDSEYGLASSIWTADVSRAHRLSEQIEVGVVWVNCWLVRDLRTPFGGVKQSGVGREGGEEALRFFTQAKNVCVQY